MTFRSLVVSSLSILIAVPAFAAGTDCPTAQLPYSSSSLMGDLLIEERATAALQEIAPQTLAIFDGKAGFKLPPGFERILTPAAILKGDDRAAERVARIDRALAPIPVSAAATVKRCASYDQVPPKLPKRMDRPAILVFDKITGFRDAPSVEAAKVALQAIAGRRGWTIVTSDNGAIFNARDLARFDAVVWNNVSGDALTVPQRAAFRRWIERGGGYVGFHGSAGDPVYIWPWYVDTLVGARFIGHPNEPQFQSARVKVEDRGPITAGLGDGWTMTEEWYSFGTNPRATGARILATLDESTYRPIGRGGESLAMGDHPIAWTRCVGRGRSFYSAIGHRPESYVEPNSLLLLERGIAWAIGRNGRDCSGDAHVNP